VSGDSGTVPVKSYVQSERWRRGSESGGDSGEVRSVLLPSAFDAVSVGDLTDGSGGSRVAYEGERPFDMVKRHTGWHPYVWFLMCRRPEMYNLGVEAGLVAKIAGEEWGELQKQKEVLDFLRRVVEFVNEHPVPRTSDKKAMKVYKQLAAKNVRTPLAGTTTAAMKMVMMAGSSDEGDDEHFTRRSASRRIAAANSSAIAAAAARAAAVVVGMSDDLRCESEFVDENMRVEGPVKEENMGE